jgi:hypothetical protein
LHWEGEGSLRADISTMTSGVSIQLKKFHIRAKIRNIFFSPLLTPPVHFVQRHSSRSSAQFSKGAHISTMRCWCIRIQLKKSNEKM